MNPIGACIWSLPEESLEAQFNLAKECGLNGLQLDINSGEGDRTLADPSMIERMQELSKASGLTFPALGIGIFCERAATDTAEHPFLKHVIESAVYASSKLSIPILQIPSFFASEIRTQVDIDTTAQLMRYACQKAADYGIQVGTENVLNVKDLARLIKAVDMPNFKVYFDTANPHAMAGLNTIESLEASFPQLVQVHLKDEHDDGRPALLGEGDTGFSQTLEALQRLEYEGWYILESPYSKVMASRNLSAHEVIKQDMNAAGYAD